MARPRRWSVLGVDLAWGEHRPDGLCLLEGEGPRVRRVCHRLVQGDVELAAWIDKNIPARRPTLVCLDAPVVCRNRTGSRPVDRLTHRLFHREQAAAHPANLALCPRPQRVVRRLRRAGFEVATDWPATPRALIEVFPHPATVRWFALPRTIKYKRGPVAARRREFARLQNLLRRWLADHAPEIAAHSDTRALLAQPWTKDLEDQTDALLCALVGWQWVTLGAKSLDVLGDLRSGFIVVPKQKQPGWLHN